MSVNRAARHVGWVLLALTCVSALSRGDVKPPLPPLRGLEESLNSSPLRHYLPGVFKTT
jgi:hypothetical protein